MIKKFFGIEDSTYKFEIYDVTTIFTIINVVLVFLGVPYAPIFGLVNCGILLIANIVFRAHINSYLTQLSLIALNSYFLILNLG